MSEPPGQDTGQIPTTPDRLWAKAVGSAATSDTDLEDLLHRRVPMRIRIAQALGLLLVIAMGTALVVHRMSLVAPTRSQGGGATPTPVPLSPVLVLSNVSSGTVILNDRPLAGSPPLVLTFRRGLNTITLMAPPFRPRTCHVQWPGRQNDGGCDFPTTVGLPHSVGGRSVAPVLIVELPFSLEDLPSAVQTQALAASTGALQSAPPQTSVPAGDYIATGQDASGAVVSRRSGVPLRAELLAAATTLGYVGDAFCDDPGCVPVSNAVTGPHSGQPEWVVMVDVSIHWRFSSRSGVVADSASWPSQLPVSLLLAYDAQQGWTVDQRGMQQLAGFDLSAALAQTACNVDIGELSSAAQQQGDTILSAVHDNRIEGCEFALQTAQGTNAGHFVWRFGVLLAADGPAHTLLPALPLAPASELAAVGA